MTTEFNANEWGIDGGLDMNFFAARFYDPVLARWHSPDPLEQVHSPYLAMCDDPANFTDPDGRAGIPFLQDFFKTQVGWVLRGGVLMAGAMFGAGSLVSSIAAIGGTIGSGVKSTAQIAKDGSSATSGGNASASQSVMTNSKGNSNSFFGGSNFSDSGSIAPENNEGQIGLYKGGVYSYISQITFGNSLGNADKNLTSRYFSTNGHFVGYDNGQYIERWFESRGAEGKEPYSKPTDGFYQTFFFRVEFNDGGHSPWGYAIDYVRINTINSRMPNSLPTSGSGLMPTSVKVPKSPPSFAFITRLNSSGSLDMRALQNLAMRASATAQRGNWNLGIYGGEGSMANSNYEVMRRQLLSNGFPSDRIFQLSKPPSGQGNDIRPSFGWR